MAFMNMSGKRFLGVSRIVACVHANVRTSSASTVFDSAAFRHQKPPSKLLPDPGDEGIFRRYLHRQSSSVKPAFPFLPTGAKVVEKFKLMDVTRDSTRFDGLILPSPVAPSANLTVDDAIKILRISLLEKMKAKLSQIERDIVSYPEFFQICSEECSEPDHVQEIIKMLDESGIVIVIGNRVFLHPNQVVKAMSSLLVDDAGTCTSNELEKMEKHKAKIDAEASKQVRRELWLGLGYLVIQTTAFMRLTFWELTWDVMEPICFYVTTLYFMGGYIFFLRTSKEPSFEALYRSRFDVKQKKMMKDKNFDLVRIPLLFRF